MRGRSQSGSWVWALVVASGGALADEVQRIEVKADTTSDIEQRRRDPVAKTIYGREELDKYGDVNVSDVLKRLPGINLQGGNPRLRGLGAGYTLILVNGEKAPPGFSLENLSPSQVERIEVTKGPSAEHSAQAVAGTINVILRDAPKQRLRELRLVTGYNRGWPTHNVNGQWGDRLGNWSIVVPVSQYSWRGGNDTFTDRISQDLLLQPQRLQINASSKWWGQGGTLGPRVKWHLGERSSIESQTFLQKHLFHSAGQAATAVLLGSPPLSVSDRWSNAGYWQMGRTGVQFNHRTAAGIRLEARLGLEGSNSRARSLTLGNNVQGQQSLERESIGQSQQHKQTTSGKVVWPAGDDHTVSVGWDLEALYRQEKRTITENGQPQAPGVEGEPFEARLARQALWLQDEWELAPRWSTSLGVRAERIHLRSDVAGQPVVNISQVVTPMWHLNHRLDDKGRDLLRMSLTRAYRAPELSQLLARPQVNGNYPVDRSNTALQPDRVGNPLLLPELSTGIDLALEKYFAGSGVMSAGVFSRRISGLIRQSLVLENVSWAAAPRWVSRPVNLSQAQSVGLEFEVKGKPSEWWPQHHWPQALSVRQSVSWYRSSVRDLPGPDNRLEGQQPWQTTWGFDHNWSGLPLTFGANLAFTPAYAVQQTMQQRWSTVRSRNLDAYVMVHLSREATWRLSLHNVSPLYGETQTRVLDDSGSEQRNAVRTQVSPSVHMSLTLKL